MYWSAEPSPLYAHARLMRVYSVAHCVCLFNIKSKETTYPAPEQGSGTVLFSVGA